jgi:hypothetical protein
MPLEEVAQESSVYESASWLQPDSGASPVFCEPSVFHGCGDQNFPVHNGRAYFVQGVMWHDLAYPTIVGNSGHCVGAVLV